MRILRPDRLGLLPLALLLSLTPSPASAAITSLDGTWLADGDPIPRYGHSAVYDPVRDRMIIFAGSTLTADREDVWTVSLSGAPTWTRLTPSGTLPDGTYRHSAIYDPIRDRIVVFGGNKIGVGFYNDVWTLSLGADPAWAPLAPTGPLPTPRRHHSAVYDPIRDRMLVFGGQDSSESNNEVWSLSLGGSPAWTQLTPSGTPPTERNAHSAIYDPARDRMVVFGGRVGTSFFNDVWALSLAGSPVWTLLTPNGPPPPARYSHAAIYDPIRDRMVVAKGASTSQILSDVWTLSLAANPAWTQLAPSGPVRRLTIQTEVYDPIRDRLVEFGGINFPAPLTGDVWAMSLSGSPAWTQLLAPPNARGGHSAIHDPVRQRMIVFGGADGSNHFSDVWARSLGPTPTWTKLTPSGIPPSGRRGHAAIHDPVRDRMLVFGGFNGSISLSDVWALSLGASPAWTQLTPVGMPPGQRNGHTAIYDPVRDRMLVFRGRNTTDYRDDTWALSLTGTPAWTQIALDGPSPSARAFHTTVYDQANDQVVMFGGIGDAGVLGDVWRLSLSDELWTPLAPAGTPPTIRYTHAAVFEPSSGRMLVFGGSSGANNLNETWALSLAGTPVWAQLAPAGSPPGARNSPSAIYDPVRNSMAVFAGVGNGNIYNNDTWELQWSSGVGVEPRTHPKGVWLAPAYPNPATRGVTIDFMVPRAGNASLRIFDTAGRLVRTLLDGPWPAGAHSVPWDRRSSSGRLAQPGLYFYELRVDDWRMARRIVLTR